MQRLGNPEIVLALDVDTLEEAKHFVDLLYPKIKLFKIGSQLFTTCGPDVVKMVGKKGGRVFLDLKFNDIPNTVQYSCYAGTGTGGSITFATLYSHITASLKGYQEIKNIIQYFDRAKAHPVFMITVHATAGIEVLQGAVKGAEERAKELRIDRPYIVGVTLLTSEKIETDTLAIVLDRARSAKEAGLDGVVCSALEAKKIREEFGNEFIIVTPGIRSDNSSKDDQKRTATVVQAVEAGSNFLVIGRPILKADNPIAKTDELLGELNGAGN